MLCQSQAYPTENKPEKARFFCFFLFQKKKQIGNPATQELRMRIKYARKLSFFCYIYKSRKLVFFFPYWDIMKCLNACMLKTAVCELVQQFYHATEFGNVANTASTCADQP